MVVAAHPMAARAGHEILQLGGNAIDAAIAVQMVLTLVEPQSSGIGGGGFLLFWNADTREVIAWDGRETAPASARPDRFLAPDGSALNWLDVVGTGRSIGTPGLVAMLEDAHSDQGRLDWKDLFEPAIRHATNGFGVSPRLNKSLEHMGADAFNDTGKNYFFDQTGNALAVGTLLKNEELAATLKSIATNGNSALSIGDLAERIVEAASEPGVETITLADLNDYQAVPRPPLCSTYRGYRICGMGPPSSGGMTIAAILKILEGHDLGSKPNADALHVILEAEKLSYADRNRYMADSDYIDVPFGLLDEQYLAERAGLINEGQTMGEAEAGTPPDVGVMPGRDASKENPGTTHVSIVDQWGNAVSMTTTIESAFGSRRMVSGFLLNNELTDFSFLPNDSDGQPIANRVEGGKRPRSSMAPTIVFAPNGEPWAIVGSPGGSRIILYVVKALVAMIDWGMNPQEAASLRAFGSRNGPAELERGDELDQFVEELNSRGHEIARPNMTSGLHIIQLTDDGLLGGADPRREGAAIGE